MKKNIDERRRNARSVKSQELVVEESAAWLNLKKNLDPYYLFTLYTLTTGEIKALIKC